MFRRVWAQTWRRQIVGFRLRFDIKKKKLEERVIKCVQKGVIIIILNRK